MGKIRRSGAWQYFVKGLNIGICKICQREVSCSGNTTNLHNHLLRHHKEIMINTTNDKSQLTQRQTTDMPDFNEITVDDLCTQEDITDAIPSTSTDATSSTSTDAAPSINIKIVQSPIIDVEKVTTDSKTLKSETCQKSQPCIDSVIKKIKSFEDRGARAAEITNALLFMIAKDNLSLNTVEKDGFHYFLKIIAPLYKIPARKQITELLDEKYEVLSLLMKKKIATATTITLTCDVWTEVLNTVSFLGITAHFLFQGELTSVSIGIYELDERHTAMYLGTVLNNICTDWNIALSKIHAVVTDNAANIVKAVEIVFGKDKHVACLAHSINLIPAKMFEKLSDLKVLIDKVKSIVTYFKHSVVAADELRKNQRASGTSLKLIQDVSTRWSSTYYMLERFMQVIDNVSAVLINLRNSPSMLSAFEVATVQEVLKILKPLEMITVEISSEKHPTISKVIPMIYLLRNKINELTPESEIGKQLKQYILQEINVRFNNIENNELYAIATVLDLRFRKMYFESQLSCSNAIHKINQLLKNMRKDEQPNINNKENLHTQVDPTSLWSSHSSLVARANNLISENGSGCLHSQLKNYLNQDALPLKANPIQYWISLENACSSLSKIALKYVSTIATSVPSERLFSRTGNIMTDNRNRLKGDRLSRLLFLSSLNIADWHLSD